MPSSGNDESSVHFGGIAATAMRHCHGRQGAAQSGHGGKKRKKGNNQPEVQAA